MFDLQIYLVVDVGFFMFDLQKFLNFNFNFMYNLTA